MAWVESETEHFHCRHNSDFEADAARVMALLERVRARVIRELPRVIDGLTVVLHDSATSLALSHPLMTVHWRSVAPSSRPYVTGWFGAREIHVLSPEALRARATAVSGSFETLRLTPASLYVRRMIVESNVELAAARAPVRRALESRWAWLLEGASRWISGESDHARSLVAFRMREGARITFPPSARDAPLLGPTVMELLARQQGEEAVAAICSRLPAQGPRQALSQAFGGKALMNIESDWRMYLREITGV